MRSFKVALILFFLFMVGACSQAQQMSKDVYKTSAKIELKLKNPDYDRVIDLLEKAKTDYPDDPEIWFLLGKIYGIKHRVKDMVGAFAQADKAGLKGKEKEEMKKILETTWVISFNLGVDYAHKVIAVERYIEQISSNWSNYTLYADSLQLISAEYNNPAYNWKNYSSAQDLVSPLEKLKEDLYKKALDNYELVMRIDSTRYEPFVNGAFAASKLNQPEKTLGYLKKAYELEPYNINVLNNYLASLLNNKNYEEALKISGELLDILDILPILKKNPNDLNALLLRANILDRLGRHHEAKEVYEKIIEQDTDTKDLYVNVLFNRAIILDKLGKEKETMEIYDKIIQQDPNSKDVHFNRGFLYLNKTSQIAKQLIALRDSLENNPKDQALIGRSKKLIDEQKDYFHKAELDFKRVHELAPDDLEAMRLLGYCYLNQDETDDAINVLEALTKREPDNKDAWSYLSIAYAKKGMVDKAKEAEKKAQ